MQDHSEGKISHGHRILGPVSSPPVPVRNRCLLVKERDERKKEIEKGRFEEPTATAFKISLEFGQRS